MASLPLPESQDSDQAELVKIVTDIVSKKPTTKEEALELFKTLQVKLGFWLTSNLPALEAKALLVGMWAVEQVSSSSCFAFLKK
jgi:hypothetical protein